MEAITAIGEDHPNIGKFLASSAAIPPRVAADPLKKDVRARYDSCKEG